jgi:hypothetical protein
LCNGSLGVVSGPCCEAQHVKSIIQKLRILLIFGTSMVVKVLLPSDIVNTNLTLSLKMQFSLSKTEVNGESAHIGTEAEYTPLASLHSIMQLLERASQSGSGLTFYSPGLCKDEKVSYSQLLEDSRAKVTHIKALPAVASSEVILIHFATHHENIAWLWAVILAGLIPAISPPFVHDEARRRKHLGHIQSLLKDPLVLTSQQLVPEFLDVPLKIQPVEQMSQRVGNRTNGTPHVNGINFPREKQSKPAVLMLTSGSTGNAKAMSLTHPRSCTLSEAKSNIMDISLVAPYSTGSDLITLPALQRHTSLLWLFPPTRAKSRPQVSKARIPLQSVVPCTVL